MAHVRTCAHCGEEFLRTAPGHPPKTCSDGCKKAYEKARSKARYEKNKEEILEKSKAYKEKNADWYREYYREYHAKNRARISKRGKSYRARNREEIRKKRSEKYQKNKTYESEYMREYRRAHPEKISAYMKEWSQNNRDKKSSYEHSRRARKTDSFIEMVDRQGLIEKFGNVCHICSGHIPEDVDHKHPLYFNIEHIVPLIHGGEHSYENCRPSHASCNQQKNNLLDGWEGILPRWPDGEVIAPLGPEENQAAAQASMQPPAA